ncbi:unnamed protein product [Prunus armeniaca]|uniref:Zinc finger GRF-type domain-containing protein n=1 Tax=Prunus armeniaca TaxID=36596 RepID=A0A6J5Y2S1_PRUAR|nr:unnamed protein product [Prunus armeniaca]
MSESSTDSNCSRRYCKCRSEIKHWTSWTDLNPRRRFEACCNNRNSKRGLHFFAWVENERCPRGKEILPGLLRRLRGMEDELRATTENFRLMEEEKNKLEQKLREEEEEIKILKKQNLGIGQQVVVLKGEILSYQLRQRWFRVVVLLCFMIVILFINMDDLVV